MADSDPSPDALTFERSFAAKPGVVERLTPLVRRIVAPNAGPYTFTGTCTYVVGNGRVAVLDPGPADTTHLACLLAALAGERLTHVVVTHTHRDHSPGADWLRRETGAVIVGCPPHAPAERGIGKLAALDAAHDTAYAPDHVLADGETLQGEDFTLRALATPGHAANHFAFSLEQEQALFSGDHVMGWSTTVVAPPDGSMRDYMASLAKLLARADAVYWPGHGGPVHQPQRFVRALIRHRRQREASILDRLAAGIGDIPTLVARLYEGLDPALRGAAALTVFAHLEDLVSRGLVACDAEPAMNRRFTVVA
jgi:glyoxylase-like metal-dependent hydrolase (beta-lactamase superfamily II)